MHLNKKNFDETFIIFLIISVIYAIGNFLWCFINTPIIPTDIPAAHFINIFEEGWLFYNAPLITWIMRGMFYVFGKEYYDLIVIFVNYIFFLLALYFIYKIGTELKDKETGNIAMILFALVPAVYGMSRQYGHQDYHIIAGITFNIYCLIKTDYFRDRKWTIWYGISVGLGLMIKDAFLAYFFVPFVYIAIAGLREKIEKTKIINILISIAIGSLISGWHYFRHEIIKKLINEPMNEIEPIFDFMSLRITTTGLWEDLLSPPLFIIFIIGLIYFIWKYRGRYKILILLWFFVPWLIIMFMPHRKEPEYCAGFIPVTALISSLFLSNIQKKHIKNSALILLIIIGLVQYADFSYDLNQRLFNWHFKFGNDKIYYCNKYNHLISYTTKGEKEKKLKLVDYLKKNYHDNSFCVHEYQFSDKDIDIAMFKAIMYLNDLHYIETDDKEWNMVSSDIILLFGKQKTVQDIYNSKILKLLKNPKNAKIFTKEFREKFFNSIKKDRNERERSYCLIDVFFMDKNKDEDTKVMLFGRKDKFQQYL